MIIVVRCVTCGKVLGDLYEYYKEECEKIDKKEKESSDQEKKDNKLKYFTGAPKKELLDRIGLERLCCRRHMLAHVDIIDQI